MSSPSFATPTLLTIDVRSRRSERRLGVLALGGVAVATWLLPLPLVSAVLFFVTASAVVLLGLQWQGWLGGADRLTAVSWMSDGSWVLSSAHRKNIPATLGTDTRVGRRWLWLRWHTGQGQRSMLLLKGDALPAEIRRLSVRLRLESVSAT
ncbi:hypothetical protein ACFPN2_23940 [Steroidobacter flavus]|uniref:Toxin CptA n=1 Tax=Steroidobacter flavus TaxID=1842136 RepID=A0ABV8SX23_9GAMM